MKKLALSFLVLAALAGCATTQSAQQGYVEACTAYGAAFTSAVQLRQAGKLNPAQIDAVAKVDAQITPLCTGPLPADPQTATAQITAAVTTLTVELAAQKASK